MHKYFVQFHVRMYRAFVKIRKQQSIVFFRFYTETTTGTYERGGVTFSNLIVALQAKALEASQTVHYIILIIRIRTETSRTFE